MKIFAAIGQWWNERLNRRWPLECHECDRASASWADRATYVGRWVWMNNGFYEGKVEQWYCAEHAHLLPPQRPWQEAKRRFYAGKPQ